MVVGDALGCCMRRPRTDMKAVVRFLIEKWTTLNQFSATALEGIQSSKLAKSRPNLASRDGQGFGIRPLFSVGAKGTESGIKGRQIRRFTQMHTFSAEGRQVYSI